jgi:ABC-2 type transport system permease protein
MMSNERPEFDETPLSSTLLLFMAILKRDVLLLVRYPVDTATRLFFTLIFFFLMFVGGKLVAGQAISKSLEGLIVGYFLWTMATAAYMGIAKNVQDEASWGTLEQLYMSPHGFGSRCRLWHYRLCSRITGPG